LKLRCLIFVVLGVWLIASSALADATTQYFSTNLISQVESLSPKHKAFEDKPLLAQNKKYFSTKKRRDKPVNLRRQMKLDGNYVKSIFSDARYALTSPFRWNHSDWVTASLVAGGTGFFFLLDDEIRNTFQDNRSSTTDDISKIFEYFGNGAIVTLP
jgi:hypothetical protein